MAGNNFIWELVRKKTPLYADLKQLEEDLRKSRVSDFVSYFNQRNILVPQKQSKYNIAMNMGKSIFSLQTGP